MNTEKNVNNPNDEVNDEEAIEDVFEYVKKSATVRRKLARKSHVIFFSVYLSKYIEYEAAPFQDEMFAITENESIPLAVITAFRNSAKSTIMTLSYPLWAILGKQEKKFVIILSQTQRQARQHLTNIKKEVENNELLRQDMGPFKEGEDEWGAYALAFPKHGAKMVAASTEQSIRGLRHGPHRPDLIICDDIEDLQSVKTQNSRDKTFNWLMGDIIPAGDKNTRTIIVGNLLHEDSVMIRLKESMENDEIDGVFRAYPLLDEEEKSAWPDKLPDMAAIKELKRRVGDEKTWQREYLLNIISDADRVIHPDWIHYYKDLPDRNRKKVEYQYTAIGIDLAISQKESADYTAMVAAHVYYVDNKKVLYILPYPINERYDFPGALTRAKHLYDDVSRGGHTTFFVETIGYQEALLQALEEDGYYAEGLRPINDKRTRLSLTANRIKTGRILFPEVGSEDLLRQLVGFGVEKHDDLADAFSTLVLKSVDYDFFVPFVIGV